MIWMVPLLVKLSEEEKRILIAIAIVLILMFVVVALFANFIEEVMKKAGRQVDNYTHDLVEQKIITNSKQFRRYVIPTEIRNYYLANRFSYRFLIIISLLVYAYFGTFQDGNYGLFFETLSKLSIEFSPWPTTVIFGFTVPSNWPTTLISKYPEVVLQPYGFVTYAAAFFGFVIIFQLLVNTIKFIGRMNRALHLSRELFLKTFKV